MDTKDKAGARLIADAGQKTYTGVELSWRGDLKHTAAAVKIMDKLLSFAALPEPTEWSNIRELSVKAGMESVWRRAHPSALENMAVALVTTLAMSSRMHWLSTVRDFLNMYGLSQQLRGRPKTHPAQIVDMQRGRFVEQAMERLRKPFQTKRRLKKSGGFESGDERIADMLQHLGFNEDDIYAVLHGRTLQDAAVRLGQKTQMPHVGLRVWRNSFARYRRLKGEAASSKAGKANAARSL